MSAANEEHIKQLLNTDLSKSFYNLDTYFGRVQHFAISTNPLNLLLSTQNLNFANRVVTAHKNGRLQDELSPAELEKLNVNELWKLKNQYNSSFHPETGQLMPWWGRMSSQVPMNMSITGGMLALSHTPALSLMWQLANQSYNAAVNYSNRSGGNDAGITNLALAWAIASGGAIAASFKAQKIVDASKTLQKLNPTIKRSLAPFAGIVLANFVNIPVMRNREFIDGISVSNEKGEILGTSKELTVPAISKVIIGRLCIAACCVMLPALVAKNLGRIGPISRLLKHPKYKTPADVSLSIFSVGLCLLLSVPPSLAIFPQMVKIETSELNEELRNKILEKNPDQKYVWYNKGL